MADLDDQQLPLFSAETLDDSSNPASPDAGPSAVSPYSKYVVYVDESGDHGMVNIDPNYPVFVLAFCVFHKRHYSEMVVSALEKFKFNHFGHDQVVLHENEIRKERARSISSAALSSVLPFLTSSPRSSSEATSY